MYLRSAFALLVCCGSFVLAQAQGKENLCNPASATTVDHDAGVIIQKMAVSGKWGRNEVMAYLPDKAVVDGAVVFSHSAIHGDHGSVDLLPFALTLARAGAAVVVPRRILTWLPLDRDANREGAAVICAEHWLVEHTKVFNNGEPTVNQENIVVRQGYAYVGPRICDPQVSSECHLTGPFHSGDYSLKHYWRYYTWVPVGETEGADSTDDILSDGGLKEARWLQRHLNLAPIEALAAQVPASGSF